ncbi:SDR family NAD(P)-dependent oxidoreductase [Actinospica sp. MGRD01-02]|uniref:SDR family NAD(P)-dependent oxidoreductase n=1 Tax=Actinospica acidithermotolerans TaxID=2828514 RepID=A0A941IFV0_9ACTN|nr:oxidoreductase [Actinospica acidithermotolerans]MBR7826740.1 SDR family NAD(P)-dependent oxidoreductase [Actinospica acidithermotolerans]
MGTWSTNDLPNLTGRTVIVTGANSGIGLATTRALAGAGAHVVLAVRDVERGRAAAASAPGSTEVRRVDLADLSSVRAFAAEWDGEISVLINNAGIMMVPEGRTADGFERQFGTNHLGHFALTNLLLPQITDRVVTLSSRAHQWDRGRMYFDNLNLTGNYSPTRAYAQSKLSNLLFTAELQRRLTAAGSSVRSLAAHPGYAATELQSHSGSRVTGALLKVGNAVFAQSAEAGALPSLYAATQDLPGDSFVGPDGFAEMRGGPKLVDRSDAAKNTESAARLWSLSEEMTGVKFPF